MPEVSIIVPVYKAEKLLSRCIDSILAQTFTDFELLLIDDGSPDNSGKICDAYAEKDNRIKVFHKENGGASSARNVGLEYAIGSYIMFCDSDDSVNPQWVETLYNAICSNSVDLGVSGLRKIKGDNARLKTYPMDMVLPRSRYIEMWLCLGPYPWNKIFRREIIAKFNLRFDTSMIYAEDGHFVLEYMKVCGSDLKICSACTYNYFENVNSITHSFIPTLWECFDKLHSIHEELWGLFSVDMEQHHKDYEAYFLWSCHFALKNYLLLDNNLSKKEKLNYIKTIVNSRFADIAIKYNGTDKKSIMNKVIIKMKNPNIIYFYYRCLRFYYYWIH